MHVALEEKLKRLDEILEDKDKIILAFSGGLDSSFLAYYLKKLGKEFYAVTVDNGLIPDINDAISAAQKIGIKHKIIKVDLFSDRVFTENNEERCYFCKKEIIKALKNFKNEVGYRYIMDATNKSDLSDYRPGILALMEEGILSPLLEAEITKEDIIELSRNFGLEIKPPESCLATRIPVYTRITKDTVEKIRFVENEIKKLGIRLVRARVHDNLLRLQFLKEDLEKALKKRKEILNIAERYFAYATVDLRCYDE